VQEAAWVSVVPVHEADRQDVELEATVQAPAPLQVPVLPQVPPAGQWLAGAAVPAARFAHVPALVPTLQDWQSPQLPLLQQTPSTQKPVPHSFPAEQACPIPFFGTQRPPTLQ
jgi:hypothetical protein